MVVDSFHYRDRERGFINLFIEKVYNCRLIGFIMRVVDMLVVFILLVLLVVGFVILFLIAPFGEEVRFEEFSADLEVDYQESVQFYPNLRFKDREISYSIDPGCNLNKASNAESAFNRLNDKTILEFYQTSDEAEISVACSALEAGPGEEEHFVAGEGGPSKIVNASVYNVILNGKISLFRAERCKQPNVATHEILHALGFDHNNDPKSILYNVTSCDQTIDPYIVEEINSLYSVESRPDLYIGSVTASKIGSYIDFEVVVVNGGLKDSANSTLEIKVEDDVVKQFTLNEISIGTQKILSVENLKVPRRTKEVEFIIASSEREIKSVNNKATIKVL